MPYLRQAASQHHPVQPVVIHRAIFGSFERFIALLIEHYAGAFPLWLAPVQAIVIPIADRHIDYAQKVAGELRSADLRVEIDARSERMQAKIREAQLQKIPYMAVVGDKELEAGSLNIRRREGGDQVSVPVAEFLGRLEDEGRLPL